MIFSKGVKKGIEVVCSAIIENSRGKILLVQSPKWSNKWILPGGHIEPGETIKAAIEREAEEEIGLKLKAGAIISYGELINSKDFHRSAHFIYFDLLCKPRTTKVKIDNQEITGYLWVKPEKALEMDLAESYPETIQNYIKYKTLVKK